MKIQWTAATSQFSARYISRGIELFNRGYVLSFEWQQRDESAARIIGTVRGSHDEVYAQTISIKALNGSLVARGVCTCPVGNDCKHVAAVLRAAIMEQKFPASLDAHGRAGPDTVARVLDQVRGLADAVRHARVPA